MNDYEIELTMGLTLTEFLTTKRNEWDDPAYSKMMLVDEESGQPTPITIRGIEEMLFTFVGTDYYDEDELAKVSHLLKDLGREVSEWGFISEMKETYEGHAALASESLQIAHEGGN